MRFRWNPIIKKDLQVASRSMRLSWGLFAYEGVLTLVFLLALMIIQEQNSYMYGGNVYSDLVSLFPSLAVSQLCIIALIMPILTASSISGEKERQTFDIMLTTCMSPFSIVLGKVFSAVLRILFYVVASIPVMALAFVVGGMSWTNLFYFLLVTILLSLLSGSIGIFCSSICRKSISAVVLSFVFYFVVYFLTFIPVIVRAFLSLRDPDASAGESMLILLFNPFVFFEEFFAWILTGESLLGPESGHAFEQTDVGFLTYYLTQGRTWLFVSAACLLLLSLLFMLAAAWMVDPMHSVSRKKREK